MVYKDTVTVLNFVSEGQHSKLFLCFDLCAVPGILKHNSIIGFIGHLRPSRLRGFPHFLFPNFAFFSSCDSAFFTLSDLARIIELSSAQLDRAEIANIAPVS